MNNTSQNGRPFFLSAFHCLDTNPLDGSLNATEKNDVQNWLFKFQYKTTTCNGNTISSFITYNYANFRSAWQSTDFVLVELENAIIHNTARFLGWNRSGDRASSATGIHHPKSEPMKITFANDGPYTMHSAIFWQGGTLSPGYTHWRPYFESGGIENGSSGSPLFDENHRVMGQLHGGSVGCSPISEYYGKFDVSWTGGNTNDTRLSNWLDSGNLGIFTLDGCSYFVNFINQTVTTDSIVNSCGDIAVQNITVENNANLILNASGEITINGPFEVQVGSQLEVK